MFAIITRRNDRGAFPDVGTIDRGWTGDYSSEARLLRYGLGCRPPGAYRVQFFRSMDYRETSPYKTIYAEVAREPGPVNSYARIPDPCVPPAHAG